MNEAEFEQLKADFEAVCVSMLAFRKWEKYISRGLNDLDDLLSLEQIDELKEMDRRYSNLFFKEQKK